MTQVAIKVEVKNSAFLREIPKESLIRMNQEEGFWTQKQVQYLDQISMGYENKRTNKQASKSKTGKPRKSNLQIISMDDGELS